MCCRYYLFFFSSRRRHTRWTGDWSSDVCSSDLPDKERGAGRETISISPRHQEGLALLARQPGGGERIPEPRLAHTGTGIPTLEDRQDQKAGVHIGRGLGRERIRGHGSILLVVAAAGGRAVGQSSGRPGAGETA